jgi:modulator of FtsH protease
MNTYNNQYTNSGILNSNSDNALVDFVKNTYKLFAASMIAGACGSYAGMPFSNIVAANYWWIAIPWILFGMFGLQMVKNKPGINMIALFAFTFVSGIIITPLLDKVLGMTGGAGIVINAFATTSFLFGALSLFAIKTKNDFTSFGKPLAIAFLIMIISSLFNIFVLNSPILNVVIQSIFLIIISFMVLIDTQNIVKGNYETPMEGAIVLYLDFFNMFTTLLQLFGIAGSSKD